jgi:hypothetical protein
MATIALWGHRFSSTNPTNTINIDTPNALGFGYNSSAWPNNIYLNATARFLTLTTGPGINTTKDKALNYISWDGYTKYRWTFPTSANADTHQQGTQSAIAAGGWTVGSPACYQCLRVYFLHGNAVNATPATIWVSSGAGGTVYYKFSSVLFMEVSATGSKNWRHSTPGDKMHLTPQPSTSTAHSWYIGMSIMPRSAAVGFCDWGYIQFSITYS